MHSPHPSRTKLKNAEIAARTAALPKIPKDALDRLVAAVRPKLILWHITKIYSSSGVTDFVICRGYRGYTIKEYFANCVFIPPT